MGKFKYYHSIYSFKMDLEKITEIELFFLARDLSKIIGCDTSPEDIQTLTNGRISNLGLREKADISYLHTLAVVYEKMYKDNYQEEIAKAKQMWISEKNSSKGWDPLEGLYGSPEQESSKLNFRSYALAKVLPLILKGENFKELIAMSLELLVRLLMKKEGLGAGIISELIVSKRTFEERELFTNNEYQSCMINLYCNSFAQNT